MKNIIWCAVVAMALTVAVRPGYALPWQNVAAVQDVNYLLLDDNEKKDMDLVIQIYLDKYPPEALLSYIYSTVENTMPPSIPAPDRQKVISHVKMNITPEIMKKMVTAGLRRNFTVDEISVLTHYDESQLSEELKVKNESFKREISLEISLLLAATSG